MNLLRAGQILKVPSAEDVEKIAAKDANQEIRTHVSDWNNYRGQVAGGVAAIPARAEPSNVASGRVASAAVTPPAAPAAEPKDTLKISKSDSGKGGGAAKGGGQERVNALQEEVTAKDKALKESQSRVADLEKQIRDMQRLLDLKAGAPAKAPDAKVAAATPPAPAKPEPAQARGAAEGCDPAACDRQGRADTPQGRAAEGRGAKSRSSEGRSSEACRGAESRRGAEARASQGRCERSCEEGCSRRPRRASSTSSWTTRGCSWPAWVGLAALGIGGFLFARRRKAGG
jgi:pilus assembly protein FimV